MAAAERFDFVVEGAERRTMLQDLVDLAQQVMRGRLIGDRRVGLGEVQSGARDGGGPGKGGTGTLTVNGKTVAEGRIDKTVPVYFSTDDTFDAGEDWGAPMSDIYEPPFTFSGKIRNVTVHAKAP